MPHPPFVGSRISLYFRGCEHPSKSQTGVGFGAGGRPMADALRVSRRDCGTENERADEASDLLLETQWKVVGMTGVGSVAGTSSASCSASSSSAGAAFLPRRDCFFSRRLIVSVYKTWHSVISVQDRGIRDNLLVLELLNRQVLPLPCRLLPLKR